MNREDLKDGEIYININSKYLFKYCKSNNYNERIGYSYRMIDNKDLQRNSYHNHQSSLRDATSEEKHHLECCIKKDKFVSYDEAMLTFIKEFVLPEKWCINRQNQPEVIKWFNENNSSGRNDYDKDLLGVYTHYPSWGAGCHTYHKIDQNYTEITIGQFKQHVLKENKLPYRILKQQGNNILQVSNQEGSIFDIGDNITSLKSNYKKNSNILSFRISQNNGNLLAVGDHYYKTGISIDKIEHYIEPVKPDIDKWIDQKNTYLDSVETAINIAKNSTYGINVQLEESLLDKAKRLYPVGTKFKSAIYKSIQTIKEQAWEDSPMSISNRGSHVYFKGNDTRESCWAEIIELPKVDNTTYEILSFIDNKDNHLTKLISNGRYLWEEYSEKDLPLANTSNDGMGATKVEMLTSYDFINYKIHSIKQLSTGKVFTIGDRVKANNNSVYTGPFNKNSISDDVAEGWSNEFYNTTIDNFKIIENKLFIMFNEVDKQYGQPFEVVDKIE